MLSHEDMWGTPVAVRTTVTTTVIGKVPQRSHALCEDTARGSLRDGSTGDDVVEEFHLQPLRNSVAKARGVKVRNSTHDIRMKRERHKPPNRLWLSCLSR